MIIMILRSSVLSADEKPENNFYTRFYTVKSFEQIGTNQELSYPAHVTQHLAMMQISSNSDSNISQVQLPFFGDKSCSNKVTRG